MAHADELRQKHRKAPEETFTLDGKFLRDEARDAIRSFFMPFSGLYAAAVGKEVRVVGIDSKIKEGRTRARRHPDLRRKAVAKRKKA